MCWGGGAKARGRSRGWGLLGIEAPGRRVEVKLSCFERHQGESSHSGSPASAQTAGHLLAISRIEADELVKRVGLANGHRRVHLEKRRDMGLRFIDAVEERQRVGEIEMRQPEGFDIRALKCIIGLASRRGTKPRFAFRPPPNRNAPRPASCWPFRPARPSSQTGERHEQPKGSQPSGVVRIERRRFFRLDPNAVRLTCGVIASRNVELSAAVQGRESHWRAGPPATAGPRDERAFRRSPPRAAAPSPRPS